MAEQPSISIGDKFNSLTAVHFVERNAGRQQVWLFKCECGNDRIANAAMVKFGGIKSCGCQRIKKVLSPQKECPRCKCLFKRVIGRANTYCATCKKENRKEWERRETVQRRERQINKAQTKPARIRKMLWSIKGSARRRNITCSISEAEIKSLIETQDWKCARTGIPLDLTAGKKTLPFGPSVDRIDGSRGYEPGNVQIVCNMYNFAKMGFSDETVLIFAKAVVEHHSKEKI